MNFCPPGPSRWTAVAIVAVAFLLRVVCLEWKPPHFDEGVNGWFIDEMTRQGFYRYDPTNFHGPLHFYALWVSQTLFGRHVWALRLPLVLVSTGCVAIALSFRAYLSERTCQLAALAMALSPGMIFYGRTAIHESWLVFFLMLTVWGAAGVWRAGRRRHWWAAALGVSGMILTKETYAIHLVALALAVPTLLALEHFSPSAEASREHRAPPDLYLIGAVCAGLVVFFYTGALLDWSGLPGLWQTFATWTATGTHGQTGHEKAWHYWLELLARYEWPAALGLLASPWLVARNRDRLVRFLAISAGGALVAYSLIAYKTPWCLLPVMWPFLFVFAHLAERAFAATNRWIVGAVVALALAGSLVVAVRLNFFRFDDEEEPYSYVQTMSDLRKLIDPLHALTALDPAWFHLRGHILLPETDSHPIPWLLADFPRIDFIEDNRIPEHVDADFLLADDALVGDLEDHLAQAYFKDSFLLRGSSGQYVTLYLRAAVFAPLFPGRAPEFALRDPGFPQE